jgi:hypothetical protein
MMAEVALREQHAARGEKYPDTLLSMRGLAISLRSAGRHSEAAEMNRTTLEAKRNPPFSLYRMMNTIIVYILRTGTFIRIRYPIGYSRTVTEYWTIACFFCRCRA